MRRKQTTLWLLGVLVGALASGGCAHADDLRATVAERAAFDLRCDANALTVTDLPGMAFGVRGCERQATYVMSGTSCQNPKQLTKRELAIYCTPVLDHNVENMPSASPGSENAAVEPAPDPA